MSCLFSAAEMNCFYSRPFHAQGQGMGRIIHQFFTKPGPRKEERGPGAVLPAADFLPHEAYVGGREDDGRRSQEPDHVGPYEKQALSQGQVAVDGAGKLVERDDVHGSHGWVHDRGDGLAVQIVRREAVEPQDHVVAVNEIAHSRHFFDGI